MKFNVYQWEDGTSYFAAEGYVNKTTSAQLIGTVDLDVQPEKREVVKEVDVILGVEVQGCKLVQAKFIPKDAYDFKITYKVKE